MFARTLPRSLQNLARRDYVGHRRLHDGVSVTAAQDVPGPAEVLPVVVFARNPGIPQVVDPRLSPARVLADPQHLLWNLLMHCISRETERFLACSLALFCSKRPFRALCPIHFFRSTTFRVIQRLLNPGLAD